MKSNNPRILELKSQRKMLYQSSEKIIEQIKKIDEQLERESLTEDIEKLNEFTDILNEMFQHPAMETHCSKYIDQVYDLMQNIDRIVIQLQEEQEEQEKSVTHEK